MGHTLRKSFRCVPDKPKQNIPRFPEEPEKTLNLSHIVPPSPLPSHNGFNEATYTPVFDSNSVDSRSQRVYCGNSPKYTLSLDSNRMDDEHRLIARYAARLALQNQSVNRAVSEGSLSFDSSRAQRELISQLESKNREILREIQRLRRQQELEGGSVQEGEENPALVTELRALRLRKDELENHLQNLQDSRRQLMVQLEGLMKMLKVELEPRENNKAIYDVRTLLNMVVAFEPPHKKRTVPQCTRCQQYGHTKSYCHKTPRCVKCAASHGTSECPRKERGPNVKCCNCGGAHPANYKGCAVYKQLQQKLFPQLRPRVTAAPPSFLLRSVPPGHPSPPAPTLRPNVSYSLAVSGGPPSHSSFQAPAPPAPASPSGLANLEIMMVTLIQRMDTMLNLLTALIAKTH